VNQGDKLYVIMVIIQVQNRSIPSLNSLVWKWITLYMIQIS